MSFYRRFWAAVLAGMLAVFLARALHVPFWLSTGAGDQVDFFVFAAMLVWLLAGRNAKP